MALVDDGNFLLGCPGAPGWTTTGLDAFVCCACAEADKIPEQTHDARRSPDSSLHPLPVICPRSRQIPQGFHSAAYLNIFKWNFRLDLQEAVLIHRRPYRFKQIDVVAGRGPRNAVYLYPRFSTHKSVPRTKLWRCSIRRGSQDLIGHKKTKDIMAFNHRRRVITFVMTFTGGRRLKLMAERMVVRTCSCAQR